MPVATIAPADLARIRAAVAAPSRREWSDGTGLRGPGLPLAYKLCGDIDGLRRELEAAPRRDVNPAVGHPAVRRAEREGRVWYELEPVDTAARLLAKMREGWADHRTRQATGPALGLAAPTPDRLHAALCDALLILEPLTGEPHPLPDPPATLGEAERRFVAVMKRVERLAAGPEPDAPADPAPSRRDRDADDGPGSSPSPPPAVSVAAGAGEKESDSPADDAGEARTINGFTFAPDDTVSYAGEVVPMDPRHCRMFRKLLPARWGLGRAELSEAATGDHAADLGGGTINNYLSGLKAALAGFFNTPAKLIRCKRGGGGSRWWFDFAGLVPV